MVDRHDLRAREAGAGRRVTHDRVGHALACDRRRNGGARRGLWMWIEESPSIEGTSEKKLGGAGAVIQGCGAVAFRAVSGGRGWVGEGGRRLGEAMWWKPRVPTYSVVEK